MVIGVFLKPLPPGSHKIMFKGGVQKQTKIAEVGTSNNISSSFAFPSGWDFETIYDLTVNNNARNGHRHYSSPSNQSSTIEKQNKMIITTTAAQHNVVKLLADMVRNRLHDAVNLLEITSQDPVIQKAPFANFISKKYMGIQANMDLTKRKIARHSGKR
jgi:hypothetical protein